MAAVKEVAAVKLPRFVTFEADNGHYLSIYPYERSQKYLCFNSTKRDLLATHEVIPVPGQKNVVMIKSTHNDQFWTMNPDWVWADRILKPTTNNLECHFKVVQISPKKVALQCLANKHYLKRLTAGDMESCLSAAAPGFKDVAAQLEFSEVSAATVREAAVVKLPTFVMFQGDNGNNLCLWSYNHNYLQFNSKNRELWGAHEVIPVPGQKNVVMIKSVHNNQFWRRSPNWIWADHSAQPKINNLDCLFKVVRINSSTVALQSLANNMFLKRLSTEGKESCLNAAAPDCFEDESAQLEVSEAISNRRVFDVEYLLKQLVTTGPKPLVLSNTVAKNNSHLRTDVSVTINYAVETSATWSDSTTVTTGLSVTVVAGIPDVSSVSGTVSTESSNTVVMGTEDKTISTLSSTFTVKDVEPYGEVVIEVSGTTATGTVPYKYRYQNTLVGGRKMRELSAVDGIFKGVQVFHITWEARDSGGAIKEGTEKKNKV